MQKILLSEKIKKIEISKYTNDFKIKDNLLEDIITSRYTKLNLKKRRIFNYLKSYNINIETLKEKIAIEVIWNSINIL